MRLFSVLVSGFFLLHLAGWENDFETAKHKAKEEHKYILLNFSGSDWCGPCIRMEKEIFETAPFRNLADERLVLVHADFPRLKKNQLSKEQQKKNEELAEKYNPAGSFPLTLLLDEDGKAIRTWEGFPDMKPEQFVSLVKTCMDARH